jgi:signal transduction histidine kinase
MQDFTQDPLSQIGVARRWAQAGIVWAVFLLLTFYYFALDLSSIDLALVIIPAAALAFGAIEAVTRWEMRMHRRYVYPHRLAYQLAKIRDFDEACEIGVKLLGEWLGLHAAVIGWLDDDNDTVRPVAAYGMPASWVAAAEPQSLSDETLAPIQESLTLRRVAAADRWFGHFGLDRVIYVPLVSRESFEGLLAIVAARNNSDVRDDRLLSALGMVMGLALDNCRLYEGQRLHAQHFRELSRMKSDFLTTVSHELRTPLTSIMMGAEMLLEDEENEDPDSPRSKLVRSIVKGASRLSSLVSDLVDVSRDDEFQPRLELDEAPLADLLAGAVSVVQPLLSAKHQTLDTQMEDYDAPILVDRLRFEQVLINLLSNAQRYSPPGGHIIVEARPIANNETLICVADCGPGVAVEDMENIFEPFYRGDRSGLGLGLAIAKSIVELHHGRIWVEQRLEGGSRFCVAIPGKKSRQRPETALRSPLHAGRR